MSESIKVSPSTLLRHAKTKMIMKDTENVKNAKKFSDLTPTKQKLVMNSYKKELKKKKEIKLPDIDKFKPDIPERYYTRADTWDGKDLKMYRLPGNYMFRVEAIGNDDGNKDPGRYVPSFKQELNKHREIIDWAVKNKVDLFKFKPNSEQLKERKRLEKELKIPIGERGMAGVKMNSFMKESIKSKIKTIDDSIESQKKQFNEDLGVKNKKQLQSVLNAIKPAVQARITQANKRIRDVEKKEAGKIASKGLIGGIGVVKKPEKVDTSKGGAGMGKEVSITEGKKFRENFKGGAKITWLEHVKKFREENPELSYRDALKEAKETYTPMRKKEREQQKLDTTEKKKSFVKKPRKLTKKQVALRFSSYNDSVYGDFQGYKPDFEKIWNEHIKGKRFKDNEELLKLFKEKFEEGDIQEKRKKEGELNKKKKQEEREKEALEFRREVFKEKFEGKIPSKFKFLPGPTYLADIPYDRLLRYHKFKSGEKGHTEYLKAQRDYELIEKPDESEKLKKKWKKLINEEKRKRKAMKSK